MTKNVILYKNAFKIFYDNLNSQNRSRKIIFVEKNEEQRYTTKSLKRKLGRSLDYDFNGTLMATTVKLPSYRNSK